MSPAKQLRATPEALVIEWADGGQDEYASVWLRDNLPEYRDPHSGQRLVDIADLPDAPRIRSASLHAGTVRVDWEGEPNGAAFDLEWLACQRGNVGVAPTRTHDSSLARRRLPRLRARFCLG